MGYSRCVLVAGRLQTPVKPGAVAPGFLYIEDHSPGEWFKRRLVPMMETEERLLFRISVRSGNCTKKQKVDIQEMNDVHSLSHTSWN